MVAVVKSIRVEPALWARAEAEALARGVKVTAFVIECIERGLDGGAAVVVEPRPKPAPPAVAMLKRVAPGSVGVQPVARHAPALVPAGDDGPMTDRRAAVRAVRCSTPDPVVPGSRLKRVPAPRR